jgi:ubiquinone/menaquinone biosynthesis C-methylase UbiE
MIAFRTEDPMHALRYDAGASAYDRLTGRWSRMYIDRVLDIAGVRQGSHVLDVATGTGDAAIVAADRVGHRDRVVAVDISVPMLQEASQKASGRAIEFAEGDAQWLSPDLNHCSSPRNPVRCQDSRAAPRPQPG